MKIKQYGEGKVMKKTLDFSKSVYELTKEYPELIEIMKNLGFT